METIKVDLGLIGPALTKDAIHQLQYRIKQEGVLFGQYGYPTPETAYAIDPTKASHKILGVEIVDGHAFATIEPLALLKEKLNEKENTKYSISSSCKPMFGMRGYKRGEDLTILTYDFLGFGNA